MIFPRYTHILFFTTFYLISMTSTAKREDIAKIRAALQRVVENYNTKSRAEAAQAGVI